MISKELKTAMDNMIRYDDLYPWYWISYGEKCYAYAVVSAFPLEDNVDYPKPGSKLEMNIDGKWEGENGVVMLIEESIATIERQSGDHVCEFIAMAHAELLKKEIEEAKV